MSSLRWIFAACLLSACAAAEAPSNPLDPGAVDQLTDVLTIPDVGATGVTARWERQIITYRLELPDRPDWFLAELRSAFAWAAAATGRNVVELTQGPVDVRVVPGPGAGAYVTVRINSQDVIEGAEIRMGCCRVRAAWEDVLQSFGPLGDHADTRSVFSERLERDRPGCFDLAALRTLYSLPAGSDRSAVAATARRVLDDTCGSATG